MPPTRVAGKGLSPKKDETTVMKKVWVKGVTNNPEHLKSTLKHKRINKFQGEAKKVCFWADDREEVEYKPKTNLKQNCLLEAVSKRNFSFKED